MNGRTYHNHREDLQTAQLLFYKVGVVIPAACMALDRMMQVQCTARLTGAELSEELQVMGSLPIAAFFTSGPLKFS